MRRLCQCCYCVAESEPVGGGFATDRAGLVIETLSDAPVTASAGNSLSVTSTVKNQGLAAGQVLPGRRRHQSEEREGRRAIDLLVVGEIAGGPMALSVYSDTDPGRYGFQACAGGDGDISESDQGNNCVTKADAISIKDGRRLRADVWPGTRPSALALELY